MPLRRAFHIILNPIAGARRSALLNAVVERLKKGGAEVTVELTERPGHATELARRAAERGRADVIVAAGGDGTINEVAHGLLGQGVPLAVIPLGTANVLAIELSLRPRAAEIADMLLTGPAHLVGTGLVGGEIFLLMVGIGFDGVVVHDINPTLKKLSGKGAFVWAGIKAWAKGPGHDIRLIADGREKRAQWAVVVNGRYFAGPYVLSREGDISQPGLMLYLFRNGGRLALIRYLIALGLGRVAKLPDVEILPVRQVRFLEPEGLAVEVDGDARGALPQTVEQGTRFLRLVVPSGWKA
ncbi:MAG: diacylglycerol kinase family protein [Parvibaculum sedimenti]|uniref:diacylglycerol/lipid kinase family protein n=1 Tax=Parvibaculum sedimenti TaxID=2608632 RepID=UPI003BB6D0CC